MNHEYSNEIDNTQLFSEPLGLENLVAQGSLADVLMRFREANQRLGHYVLQANVTELQPNRLLLLNELAEFWGGQLEPARKAERAEARGANK